jgi:hypothetical protein
MAKQWSMSLTIYQERYPVLGQPANSSHPALCSTNHYITTGSHDLCPWPHVTRSQLQSWIKVRIVVLHWKNSWEQGADICACQNIFLYIRLIQDRQLALFKPKYVHAPSLFIDHSVLDITLLLYGQYIHIFKVLLYYAVRAYIEQIVQLWRNISPF